MHTVRLSQRWRAAGRLLHDYEPRVDLEQPLIPGDTAALRVPLRAPAEPGSYQLQFDLVYEGVSWFEAMGARPNVVQVTVR